MTLSPAEKRELVLLMMERERRAKERRLFSYTPYPKQLEFHAAGFANRERLLMAGNQLGKTVSMGFEAAMHLTGRYPGAGEVFYPTAEQLATWEDQNTAEALHESLAALNLLGQDVYPDGWPGKRFSKPIWMWAASVSGDATRDNPQRILIGPPTKKEEWGTGAVPKSDLLDAKGQMSYAMQSGVSDGLDHILVNHVAGGQSILQFKSYTQGREKWQGPSLDFVWFDEEPPMDIYMEGLTRTNATNGSTALTFTPLLGFSDVCKMFISSPDELAA